MKQRNLIVVFDDGETFNDIRGCRIMEVTDEGLEALNDGEYPKNLDEKEVVGKIGLDEVLYEAEKDSGPFSDNI